MCAITPNHGKPIGRKAAQPGPFVFDALNVPIDHGLKPINGGGDVQFLRRGVAGGGCGFVMRAEPQAAARIGFEIETAVQPDDQGQVRRNNW